MLIGMKKRDFRGNKMLTKLEELIGKGHVLYDEPMKKHTTFRVGGPARALVEPGKAKAEKSAVRWKNATVFFWNGSGNAKIIRYEKI